MNALFEAYLSPARYSQHRPVAKARGTISQEQALEDLAVLRYLMENRYCGWDYYCKQGLCWDACFSTIQTFIEADSEPYISDFCRTIHRAFDRGIVDNHLSFCSPLTGRLTYHKQFSAYFADFQVEERENEYYVAESTCLDIVVGDRVDAPDNLFSTLPRNGHRHYLVGTRSFSPVTQLDINVNGQKRTVPLHRCKAIRKTTEQEVCLQHTTRHGMDILRANCCDYVGGLTEDSDLVALGRQFRDKTQLILNYLSNEGATTALPENSFED